MDEFNTDESLGLEVIEVTADSAVALDPITRAEIDIAITTAKKYPRELRRFADTVGSMATIDQETAEGCFYSLRRQGKTIQGPSVRLAEIAVSAWGNIRAGARILGETEDGKFIRAMGVCHDLERNVYIAMESQRRITTKTGSKYSDDMIGVTANAAAAIGFRNAAFKVIPGAMLKGVYNKCIQVATGGAKTLRERREQVFERLRTLSPMITDERILASLGKPSIDEVTLDDVAHLIGLGTAIRDRATEIDEAFPERAKVSAGDVLKPNGKSAEKADEKSAATVSSDENPNPEAKPREKVKQISAAKVASLRRQGQELAGMNDAALDSFCQFKFGCDLSDAKATDEVEILDEIKRLSKANKKNGS